MAISLGDALLKIGIDVVDFNKDMEETNKKVKTMTEKWQTGLKVVGTAFTALGAAGLKFVNDAKRLNATLDQTAITLGMTAAEMRDFTLATVNASFSIEDVAATLETLARAGVRGEETLKATAEAFDSLGDATGATAAQMADLLVPAFRAFGVELPKTSADLDKFTWLARMTTVDLSDFGSVLTYMAPNMQALNITMEDAISIIAALEAKGITGAAATRKFRTAITELTAAQEDAASGKFAEAMQVAEENLEAAQKKLSKAQKESGGSSTALAERLSRVTAELGKVRAGSIQYETLLSKQRTLQFQLADSNDSVAEATKAVSKAQKAYNDAVAKANSEQKSFAGILGLTQDELDKQKTSMTEATGMTDKYSEAAEKHITLLDKLKEGYEEFGLRIGTALTPLEPLLGLMTALGSVMFVFSTVQGMATLKTAAHTTAMIAQKVVMLAISTATKAWAAVQWVLNAALTANPIGLIILAVVALIAIVILLVKNWDKVVNFFKKSWEVIKKGFEAVGDFFKKIWDAIVNFFKGAWDKVIGFFKKAGEILLVIMFPIPYLIMKNWNKIVGFFKGIWEAVVGVATTVWNNVVGFFAEIIDTIKTAWSGLTSFFSDLWHGILNIIKGVINGILAGVEGFVNFFIRGINWIISGLNKIHVSLPDWIPLVGGKSFGINISSIGEIKLPRLAEGGIITRPTPVFAGEAGAEVIAPLDRLMLGANITYITVMIGDEKVAEMVDKSLDRRKRIQQVV